MFQNLEIFQIAGALAKHAGQRQAVTARNLANADTPGYHAQDLTPFKDLVPGSDHTGELRATRAKHLNGTRASITRIAEPTLMDDRTSIADPNGNSVSVETEILRSVDAKREHDRALAIFRSSLTILRTSLGRG